MIVVEKTDSAVRVTIPKDAVPPKQLNAFLDWLRLEEIAQRSGLTGAEADRTAEDLARKNPGMGVTRLRSLTRQKLAEKKGFVL